jgi:phosphoglycerate dehydrogenase-like enzyme
LNFEQYRKRRIMSDPRIRVAVLDDFEKISDTVPAYDRLKARADVTIFRQRLDTSEKIVAALKDFNILLLMRERTCFSVKEYNQLPGLRFIAQTGRTSKHLDLAEATRLGIAVAGTPSDSGTTTKELTIGLILALMRKIPQVNQRMREEIWPGITGNMLAGKTVGVLGLGRIGCEVARILKVFNTRVLAYSRNLTPEKAAAAGAECVSLQELLREADVITIHIPLNDQTRDTIGEKEIALMKPGALLVNTARGPIISEAALIKALERGHLGGVGLDVYDKEPLPLDHPLRRFDNAILMSHRGYATHEILSERYEEAMQNILKFIERQPLDLLNPEVQIRS